MGLFVSATGMGRDTFDVAAHVTRRLRGGLGIATVAANAVFAACTGTSIASASIFTKVAVPQMVRHGYQLPFAVGVVTGSSVLGMLIPPSLLMIIFGVLANTSIGDLFTAGIVPGIVLAACVQPVHFHAVGVAAGARVQGAFGARPRRVRRRSAAHVDRQGHPGRHSDLHRAGRDLRRLLHADRSRWGRRVRRVSDRGHASRDHAQDLLGRRRSRPARSRPRSVSC